MKPRDAASAWAGTAGGEPAQHNHRPPAGRPSLALARGPLLGTVPPVQLEFSGIKHKGQELRGPGGEVGQRPPPKQQPDGRLPRRGHQVAVCRKTAELQERRMRSGEREGGKGVCQDRTACAGCAIGGCASVLCGGVLL